MKTIKQLIFAFRYKRAVRQANRLAQETGLRYYVLSMGCSLKVVPKQTIKQLVQQHRFRKGTKVKDIEKIALHITK